MFVHAPQRSQLSIELYVILSQAYRPGAGWIDRRRPGSPFHEPGATRCFLQLGYISVDECSYYLTLDSDKGGPQTELYQSVAIES